MSKYLAVFLYLFFKKQIIIAYLKLYTIFSRNISLNKMFMLF